MLNSNLYNYNKNFKLSAIFSKKNLIKDNIEYYSHVQDILNNEVVLKMKDYIQHGNTTCYQHCINASYYSYLLCQKLNFNKESAARAGILHDLFLYDWHTEKSNKKLFEKHGFTHPKIAFINANKYFKLNDIEKDIILKHMWPLTISLPKYKETYVIVLIDKICSILEFMCYYFPCGSGKKYKNCHGRNQ